MAEEEIIFQEAVNAIQKGENARGRDLLTRLIKLEKNNPQVWLQMSAVVETNKERVFCLKEVVRLEPKNETARRGLILLGENPPDESLAIPLQAQSRNWAAAMFSGPAPEKEMQRARLMQILMAVGAVVVLAAIISIAVFSINNKPKPALVFENPFPTATIGPTPTYEATASPVVRSSTPTPRQIQPLIALLQATYTPTALKVNTPHPRTEAYRSAISAYSRGDWSLAANYLQQVLTIEPNAVDIHYLLGEIYRQQNKYKEAVQSFEQAIKINPNFAPPYLGRARARQTQAAEPSDPIRADLEKAISLDPTLGEAYLELAALKMRKKETKDLQRDLDFAAKLLPDTPQVFVLRAQYNLAQSKPEIALNDAQRAYQLDITYLPVYRLLAEAFRANKRLADSIQPLEIYTRYETKESEPFYWLAQGYLDRNGTGDQQAALQALDQSLDVNNLNHDAHIQRGLIYIDLNDGKKAMDDFVLAAMLRANSFPAMLGKGRASVLLNDGAEAYNFYSKSLPLAANNAERATAFYWRAQGLEQLKLIPSALADWEALLKLPVSEVPQQYRETALQRAQALATATPTATMTRTPTSSTPIPSTQLATTRTPTPTFTPTPSVTPTY